tara:strand:- start:96 stop:311 length:216 start_codon:yes stop_codon:yes gene_type:complete
MNDRRPRPRIRRIPVEAMVRKTLKGEEKRFSFIHRRGGSLGVSGGGFMLTVPSAPVTLKSLIIVPPTAFEH